MHINYMLSTTSENIQAAASTFSPDRSNIYDQPDGQGQQWPRNVWTHVPVLPQQHNPFFRNDTLVV